MKVFKLQVNSEKVSGSHSNFPVYVDLSNMPQSFWDEVKNGGGDIRCYSDAELTTQLAREVVSCDTSTDMGELHIKTGISTSTIVYITVDGTSTEPAANSTYGSENAWNSNYKAVYHFNETSGTVYDATANSNDLTAYNSPTYNQTGKIGRAMQFDGTNDYLNSNTAAITGYAGTISTILKPSAYNGHPITIVKSNNYHCFGIIAGETPSAWVCAGAGTDSNATSASKIDTTNWHHLAARYVSATNRRIYVNGSGEATDTNNRTPSGLDRTVIGMVGGYWGTGAGLYAGLIDEVRIANIDLGTDWLATEKNNLTDIDNFWTISEVAMFIPQMILT